MGGATIEIRAMDTTVSATSVSAVTSEWKDRMTAWFRVFERTASRFDPNSCLSRFNSESLHTTVCVDPVLYDLMEVAFHYAVRTGFLFNPFVGGAMDALGYDRPFSELAERQEKQFDREEIPFSAVDEGSLVFFPDRKAILKRTREAIDLGGIGKGWSVDEAAKRMQALGVKEGMVNAGGDMVIWGEKEQPIGIAHPFDEEKDIVHLQLSVAALATSSKMARRWKRGNNEYHHLLDGRTGLPAETDIIQVTAITTSVAEAEVITKGLSALPSSSAVNWMTTHFPGAACVCITKKGQLVISENIQRYAKKVKI